MSDARQRLIDDLEREGTSLGADALAVLQRVDLCYFDVAELTTSAPRDPEERLSLVLRLLSEHVDATETRIAATRAELAAYRRRGLSVVNGGLVAAVPGRSEPSPHPSPIPRPAAPHEGSTTP